LLNLYLDHEISAADAVRLENEIRHNAERRQVYREYCRMQQACRILASEVAEAGVTSGAKAKVVPIRDVGGGPSRRSAFYFAGSAVAAAACIAFAFVSLRNRTMDPVPSLPAGASSTISSNIANTPPVSVAATGNTNLDAPVRGLVAPGDWQTGAPATRLSLMRGSLVLSSGNQAEPMDGVAIAQPMEMDQLAWMRNFQLVAVRQPAEIDQLRFITAPASLRPEARRLGGRSESEAAAEWAAFRFVK
jgi:hypothetical protein